MIMYSCLVECSEAMPFNSYPVHNGFFGRVGSVVRVRRVAVDTVEVLVILDKGNYGHSIGWSNGYFSLLISSPIKEFRLKELVHI